MRFRSPGYCVPNRLGSSRRNDTQVQVRKCIADNNFIRKSVCRSRRTRRRCWYGLVSSTRLLEGRLSCPEARFSAVRDHGSPFLSPSACRPLWVKGKAAEVPSAGKLRPPCPVHPVTPTRKYGSADALRATTSYGKAFAPRAELVVDVGMG